MSLDVYLTLPRGESATPRTRIFVRRDGRMCEITREEWDEMHPGREPVVVLDDGECSYVYEANITHNLGRMATACGLYEPLWCPDELGITRAGDLAPLIRDGLGRLVEERERMEAFNPSNGWGDYDGLVLFTAGYLAACEEWPDAAVETSR